MAWKRQVSDTDVGVAGGVAALDGATRVVADGVVCSFRELFGAKYPKEALLAQHFQPLRALLSGQARPAFDQLHRADVRVGEPLLTELRQHFAVGDESHGDEHADLEGAQFEPLRLWCDTGERIV